MSEATRPKADEADSSVSPAAVLPELDERELEQLRQIGERWPAAAGTHDDWERRLPVDPRLSYERQGLRHSRFVGIRSGRPGHPEDLEATAQAGARDSRTGAVTYALRRLVLGAPLRSTAVAEERLRKLVALPILSSDALSSVAYGPEAMLAILVLAGSSELKLALPIGAAIVVLMLAVGIGYRQVIRAFPQGGGSYVVAGHSIGPRAGLLAGAGLIIDYTLTVAVSVASGVAAVTSAIPSLSSATVPIGLGVIALLVAGNLRGARSAGAAFSAPTYLFVLAIALVVIVGLVDALGRHPHVVSPPHIHATEALTALLVLRAFSSGATAMTGIEAISNAVPAFQPPEATNARRTLTIMIGLLVSMFVGVVVVAHLDGIAPNSRETVLSQLAHSSLGGGVLYGFVQTATALVLLLAANTAFNGLPRLLFFIAKDGYAPRAFLRMGDRLAFTTGIIALAILAALLYAGFGGRTNSLIPLYAVGVFLAFTLSQSGMVIHWRRLRDRGWKRAAAINGVGAVLSGIVLVITAVTKFVEGAWLVLLLIPLLVLGCLRIHRHYVLARRALRPTLDDPDLTIRTNPSRAPGAERRGQRHTLEPPVGGSNFVVVAIAALDRAALRALYYAVSLDQPLLALHVSPTKEEAERFHRYWTAWGDHVPLEVVDSPFRAVVAPLANYIQALHRQRPDVTLTVVVPELVPGRFWQRPLHGSVGPRLRRALRMHPGIVITSVLFHLPA